MHLGLYEVYCVIIITWKERKSCHINKKIIYLKHLIFFYDKGYALSNYYQLFQCVYVQICCSSAWSVFVHQHHAHKQHPVQGTESIGSGFSYLQWLYKGEKMESFCWSQRSVTWLSRIFVREEGE